MLDTLIVEDEELARMAMTKLVNQHDKLELIGACASVKEAIEVLKKNEVDLIILDIEMPEESGFSLLDSLPVMPAVVVTTSKEEYAFEAFQYEVTDYLKKPIKPSRFKESIQKVLDKTEKVEKTDDIYVKTEGRYIRLHLGDICYIENVGDYVKIILENESHVIYTTMKRLESKLPTDKFLRVHRSFIVNLNRIVDIEQNSILIKDKLIPISRAAKPELLDRLNMI